MRHARVARLALRGTTHDPVEGPGSFDLLAGASRVIPVSIPAKSVTAVEATAEDGSLILVSLQSGSAP